MSVDKSFINDLRKSAKPNRTQLLKDNLTMLMKQQYTADEIRTALKEIEQSIGNMLGKFDDAIVGLKRDYYAANNTDKMRIFTDKVLPFLIEAKENEIISVDEMVGYSKEFVGENVDGVIDIIMTDLKQEFKDADDIDRMGIFRNKVMPVLKNANSSGIITEEEKMRFLQEFENISDKNPNPRNSDSVHEI